MSWTVVYLLLFLGLSPGSVIASDQVQMVDIKVLERGENKQCSSIEERENARIEIHQFAVSVITTTLPTATTASTTTMPSTTTSTTTAMSTIASTTTVPTTTAMTTMSIMINYSGPGWRRVAFINMTDTSYNCPSGLSLASYSKRTCGRSHTTAGCSSTTFSVGDLPYSNVCGRIEGYQFG